MQADRGGGGDAGGGMGGLGGLGGGELLTTTEGVTDCGKVKFNLAISALRIAAADNVFDAFSTAAAMVKDGVYVRPLAEGVTPVTPTMLRSTPISARLTAELISAPIASAVAASGDPATVMLTTTGLLPV